MTTLEHEQKDILEKLKEIALEANLGTVDRVYAAEAPNGMPKAVAVTQEAMKEIKRLRESVAEYEDLIGICNERTYRKKFNEEVWEKELGHKLSTPDFDFVYKLFFEQREKIKELENKSKDLRLYEMQMKNGEINMTFGSENCNAFVYNVLQAFTQNGGKNFVSTTVEVDGKELGGRYALTIQKVGGLTPIEKLRKEIDRLNCVIADLSETIKEYESELAKRK